MEWARCRLPRLKTLILGHYCPVLDPGEDGGTSGIEVLHMCCPTTILVHGNELCSTLTQFLGHLPILKELYIHLCDVRMDVEMNCAGRKLSPSYQGDFEMLITALSPLAATLEVLVIDLCHQHDHPNFLEYISPLSTLSHSESIWCLCIPQEALSSTSAVDSHAISNSLLPCSIREPCISWPHASIVEFLGDVARSYDSLSELCSIKLLTCCHRGADYEWLVYQNHKVWTQIRNWGNRHKGLLERSRVSGPVGR